MLVKDETFFLIKEGGDGKFTLNKNTTQLRTPNLSELISILSHEMLVHIEDFHAIAQNIINSTNACLESSLANGKVTICELSSNLFYLL